MDWGLFDSKAGDNKFLREEIVYSGTVSLSIINSLLSRLVAKLYSYCLVDLLFCHNRGPDFTIWMDLIHELD